MIYAHFFCGKNDLRAFFVAKTIYALRPESFCALKVAIWKVQTFWASGVMFRSLQGALRDPSPPLQPQNRQNPTFRVTLIVPSCHPGWEEMENLRGNLIKIEEIWEEIIPTQDRMRGRATINVTLSTFILPLQKKLGIWTPINLYTINGIIDSVSASFPSLMWPWQMKMATQILLRLVKLLLRKVLFDKAEISGQRSRLFSVFFDLQL